MISEMKNITTIGRILFAIPFATFRDQPFPHDRLLSWNAYLIYPAGAYTIILTGIMLIVASISIITKNL